MNALCERRPTTGSVVTTPDGTLTALVDEGSVTVHLVPGRFGSSTPSRLAATLASLGEQLCRGRADADGVRAGRSADGSVRVLAAAGSWSAELEPAAYTRGEAAFCAAASEALTAVLARLGGRA